MGTVPSSTAGSLPYSPVPEALLLPIREALAGARRESGLSDPFPDSAETRSERRQVREGSLDRKLIIA